MSLLASYRWQVILSALITSFLFWVDGGGPSWSPRTDAATARIRLWPPVSLNLFQQYRQSNGDLSEWVGLVTHRVLPNQRLLAFWKDLVLAVD